MRTYRIGRDEQADIVISDPSVSRDHADLIQSADGRFYFIDRHSTNGSFRSRNGAYEKISKEFLAPDEPIRLGKHDTTITKLLRIAVKIDPAPEPGPRGPVERDSRGIPVPRGS